LAALEAVDAGHVVTLFEGSGALMNRASRWNEGKLHLGYIYANDPTGRTAQTMIDGSFHFIEAVERLTGTPLPTLAFSQPFTYLVDRDSLLTPHQIETHFRHCDELIQRRWATGGGTYPGYHGGSTFRRLSDVERATIAGDWCLAAFETVEVSVDPHLIADSIVTATEVSSVEVRLGARIESIEDKGDAFALRTTDGIEGPFDHIVNAAWEDRLRLDLPITGAPRRPFLHRYKVALHHTGHLPSPLPSVSVVLGPYGDVVSFGDRSYLSWYPACRIGASTEVEPPSFGETLTNDRRGAILRETVAEFSRRLPSVAAVADQLSDRTNTEVEGGFIFAWGAGDVDEMDTELHERHDVGVRSVGSYHSVDTGKYCLAASFAADVRIALGDI
jgi:hypothetical protein